MFESIYNLFWKNNEPEKEKKTVEIDISNTITCIICNNHIYNNNYHKCTVRQRNSIHIHNK
jgi:hypothetical protein